MDIQIIMTNNMTKITYRDVKGYDVTNNCLFVRMEEDEGDVIIPLDKILYIKILPAAI